MSTILLAGHPFAPIGVGEHMRCTFRSLRSVGVTPGVLDIYGMYEPEGPDSVDMKKQQTRVLAQINIFHINGDEVDRALAHLSSRDFPDVYNVIQPVWELARYPREWAAQLERFDEVWASSRFVQESIESVVRVPVTLMPQACEVRISSFLGRRFFGIPETAFTFLFFFDFRSYVSRKNPHAVVECFRRILKLRPYAPVSLVVKSHGAEDAPEEAKRFFESLSDIRDRIVLIDETMSDNQVKNLIRCCDCFVSLHRSEGFGRGLAESMWLGKPVIATAYSGNVDFMNPETSMMVRYEPVPVPEGAYPYGDGQVWAEPDLEDATRHMLRLIDDPDMGREIGRRASLSVRRDLGYRKTGLRYLERLQQRT